MITTLIDLGWCIGKLEIGEETRKGYVDLTIVSPSVSEGGAGYSPAESISIPGQDSINNLQKALNDAFPNNAF